MRRICVHHAGCPDGFGAAWATWRAWGRDGEFVARGHEDRMGGRDVEDALVAFVDIAPDNDEILQLAEAAAHLIVLDHHVTAAERLQTDSLVVRAMNEGGHVLHFDMTHSGAVLAWQYFLSEEPVPDLLRYVEDQDLWNWKLDGSEAVNAAISSQPHEFEAWETMAALPVADLTRQGEAIVRRNRVEVDRALRHAAPLAIGSRRVEGVNARTNRSAIGHGLAERHAYGEPWGCVYRIDGTRVHATLYSIGDFDVATIATSLGGGGHKNAAGFSVPLEEWVRDFVC